MEMEEKKLRGPARLQAEIAVRYGSQGEMLEGKGEDISERGIGFTGEKVFFPGATLDIEFCIDPAGAEWFKAQGVVRDARQERMGVEFVEMDEAAKLRILKAIYRQSTLRYQA